MFRPSVPPCEHAQTPARGSAAGSSAGEKAIVSFLRGRLLNLGPQYCSEAEDLLSRAVRPPRPHMIATSATNDDADKAGCDAYTGVECVRSCERIAL
jgi:hypothetical protein